jgi:hypothetical protein
MGKQKQVRAQLEAVDSVRNVKKQLLWLFQSTPPAPPYFFVMKVPYTDGSDVV